MARLSRSRLAALEARRSAGEGTIEDILSAFCAEERATPEELPAARAHVERVFARLDPALVETLNALAKEEEA